MTDRASSLLKAVWNRPSGRAGLVALVSLVLLALIGPFLLPDPTAQGDLLTQSLLPPGTGHLLGTDQLSRDVLSRVLNGLRLSLIIGLAAALLAVAVGAAIGILAGSRAGAVDALLMRTVDALLAIPRLFILLLVLAVWDRVPLPALVLLLALTGWYGTSRLVRAETRPAPRAKTSCARRRRWARAGCGSRCSTFFRTWRPRSWWRARSAWAMSSCSRQG